MRLTVESRLDRVAGVFGPFPWSLWLVALVLGAIGVVFIHSATLSGSEQFAGQDRKHAIALVALAATAAAAAFVPRARLLRHAWTIYAAALVALALVPFCGVTINGARRWFGFGSMTVQPTEFLKPALVLVLAHWLRYKSNAGFWGGVGVPLLLTALPMWFMVRQPDLGSALSLLPPLFAMCYAAGARVRTLLLIALLGALCVAVLFPFLHSYQKARILVWLAQDSLAHDHTARSGVGYHLWQSLIAVGAGGTFGSGLFDGWQNRYDYLPYRSTDFLFAVIAEEKGFAGATVLIAAYLGFCIAILRRAAQLRDRFGRLLATGVAVMFATHLVIHVGVCTGLLPPTGLPLPLLSYGRSSVAGAWLGLALVAHAVLARERNLGADRNL